MATLLGLRAKNWGARAVRGVASNDQESPVWIQQTSSKNIGGVLNGHAAILGANLTRFVRDLVDQKKGGLYVRP